MTPIFMVSWAAATSAQPSNATKKKLRFMSSPLVDELLLGHPAQADIRRLLEQFRLSLIVMRGALDDVHGLVAAAGGVVDDARVRLRDCIVGRILDRKQRHRDRRRAAR